MTGHVLDIVNQPLGFFLLLVGTGSFLIVGELRAVARGIRRTAGSGGATDGATSVRSPGPGRRYRLGLLAAAGLLLLSAFGSTSASFTLQLAGGMTVNVALPSDTPTPSETGTATPVPAETGTPATLPTDTATAVPTETPTATDTATAAPSPTDTPTPEPTATPEPAPTEAPTPTPTPAPQAS